MSEKLYDVVAVNIRKDAFEKALRVLMPHIRHLDCCHRERWGGYCDCLVRRKIKTLRAAHKEST